MKIYAIKSITWIEDHYENDNYYKDSFFLNRESAKNKLDDIRASENILEDKFIEIEKDGVQYLLRYSTEWSGSEDITNENAVDYLWENDYGVWYYIKELEVQ